MFLDVVSFGEHLLGSAKVNISRGEIVQGLVVTLVVVMLDERGNGLFELPGEIVVLQANNVFERAMPALNLALGHGMVGLSARVLHPLAFEPIG